MPTPLSRTSGFETNRSSPSRCDRNLATSCPLTLLPDLSSSGENVPRPPLPSIHDHRFHFAAYPSQLLVGWSGRQGEIVQDRRGEYGAISPCVREELSRNHGPAARLDQASKNRSQYAVVTQEPLSGKQHKCAPVFPSGCTESASRRLPDARLGRRPRLRADHRQRTALLPPHKCVFLDISSRFMGHGFATTRSCDQLARSALVLLPVRPGLLLRS
jgi:hypothetical protein